MKKLLLFVLFLFIFSGCGDNKVSEIYNGSVTDYSKKYLDKGYVLNVYREIQKAKEDSEDSGKGYVRIRYNVITDYFSTNELDSNAGYNIKKKIVSNVRVISKPKKGLANELYGNTTQKSIGDALTGTNNKFELQYDKPHSTGVKSSVSVVINNIGNFDATSYKEGEPISIEKLYNAIGITKEDVTLTLGFRVELITVDNKTLYKDYEIILPPSNFDITGNEFYVDLTTEDVNKMEPFSEK